MAGYNEAGPVKAIKAAGQMHAPTNTTYRERVCLPCLEVYLD